MRYVLLALLFVTIPLRADDLGLKVPPGFKVTLWADHTLANDIFTMALDDKGRVVVSGPGYVRRLEDSKGAGKADKATDVEETKTGLMGLCFDIEDSDRHYTITSGDGRLFERATYPTSSRDEDREFRDFFPQKWKFSEHGGHAVKIGPDTALYAIAGNDTKLDDFSLSERSPVRAPEAGGILRFPNFLGWVNVKPEIIAHGFRNPYDFDFTPYGDIITFDSDTERDYLLPWYTPTRVYHVLPGAHHGWRLSGYQRSLARPDYYPDTVEMLADMGRGSPTGVCCYRHTQFPKHYRGGVFLADWTFGKICYMPLIPEGSSYKKVKPEVFLESTGTNGFAPTAMRVGPDGSLFISIGGRGTRGAVYKVEYLVNGKAPVIPPAAPASDLDKVLNAPQPLEAWSMAQWKPVADKLQSIDFVTVAEDEKESDVRRVRAIELLAVSPYVESSRFTPAIKLSHSELVRTRAAWALGLRSSNDSWDALRQFMIDDHPRVRIAALTAIADRMVVDRSPRFGWPVGIPRLIENLAHEDRRVRMAAARVVALLPDSTRRQLIKQAGEWSARAVCTLVIGESRSDGYSADYFYAIAGALERTRLPAERVDLIRALMICFGDWKLSSTGLELWAAYGLGARPESSAYHRLVMRGVVRNLLAALPSTDPHENLEASRLLAMLGDDQPDSVRKVLAQITANSHPTNDFHYLTVLSRLTAPRDEAQAKQVADALLGMEKKLAGRQLRIKQNWSVRLGELVGELLRVHPGLDKVLAAHPNLVQPGHVVVAAKLTGIPRREAACRFLAAVKTDEEFPLSAELIDLLAGLPREDFRPVLRARWSDRSLRGAIVRHLTDRPEVADRDRFLEVLETAPADVTRECLDALSSLPADDSPVNLVPLLVRLRQALSEPKEARLRREIVDLVNRQAGQGLRILESKTDASTLAKSYRPVFEWFEKAHPAEAKRLNATGEDEATVREMLPSVKWEAGDLERGRKLFRDRGCQTCHGGSARLGPDLAGVSKRMSRDDLLTAIVNPSRDVAPAYRVTNVDMKDGKRLSGIVVFESADGLIVQTGAAETRRVASEDIESRSPSPKSLMPDGLLKGLRPEDLADLFAFLAKQ